jgi:hypothetical protein
MSIEAGRAAWEGAVLDPSVLYRDFVIDPDNGGFIGFRYVLTEEEHGMPAGTVRAWSSTTTAVVDTAGEEPTR